MGFKSDKFKDIDQHMEASVKGFNVESNLKKAVSSLADGVLDGASNFVGKIKRTKNSMIAQIFDGIPYIKKVTSARTVFPAGEQDWRVKLGLPEQIKSMFNKNDIMGPLIDTNGLVFPTNPTVLVSQEANYNSLHPVHTNYPFWAYQNSQVGQITITANFPVQNSLEARYWIACIHYLRTVTKMNYGRGPGAGEPPPVVKFSGYGDYVFKNVPVVVTSFQFDMPQDVDYISTGFTPLGGTAVPDRGDVMDASAWAPTTSLLTVSVVPQYSRRDVSTFDMKKFIKGDYGKGDTGFI
jgi:hypothetical protein